MKLRFIIITLFAMHGLFLSAQAQSESAKLDSLLSSPRFKKIEKQAEVFSRLTLGGYGEVAMTRNFYSDNINRYSHAETTKTQKAMGVLTFLM